MRIPDRLEYVGVSPVKVNPASAIGGPRLGGSANAHFVSEVGPSLVIELEYVASDCHKLGVEPPFGHIPPNTYMLVCEALALTNVEKVIARERKFAPPETDVVPSIVFVFHVPLPCVVLLSGVNRHSSGVEEQEPVYTDISPAEEIAGMYASDSLPWNGRLADIVLNCRFDVDMLDDMFKDKNSY